MPLEFSNNLNPLLLHEKIFITCRNYPDKVALQKSTDPESAYTYGDIADLAPKIAAKLTDLGVNSGDKVGLLSENCPEWGIVYLSILCAGAIVVPFDPALKAAELGNLLELSNIILFLENCWIAIEKLLKRVRMQLNR